MWSRQIDGLHQLEDLPGKDQEERNKYKGEVTVMDLDPQAGQKEK